MTELSLSGRGALVTGGGSGIGLAVARRLAADGAAVTIGGRSEERLRLAAEQLGESAPAGVPVGWVVVDVADEEQVRSAVAAAAEPAGGLHLAALAAGTGTLGPLVVTPVDAWRAVLETNLTGAFLCIKHAAPAMVRAGGGAIVAVSSIAGPLTHRYMAAYAVSKAGLESLVRNAADELGRAGVRVNAVRPGLVPTELSAALAGDDGIRADYLAQMPLARLGTPDDVADGVRYLLGPESAWVTGQCLAIDGGHTLRRGPDLEVVTRMIFGDDAVEGRVAP